VSDPQATDYTDLTDQDLVDRFGARGASED
jgi:hypothetical protein